MIQVEIMEGREEHQRLQCHSVIYTYMYPGISDPSLSIQVSACGNLYGGVWLSQVSDPRQVRY